jgi:hypothetical protein
MAPASAGVLSALRKARDFKVKNLTPLSLSPSNFTLRSKMSRKTCPDSSRDRSPNRLSQSFTLSSSRRPAWRTLNNLLLPFPFSPSSNDDVPQAHVALPTRSNTSHIPPSSANQVEPRSYVQALKEQAMITPTPQPSGLTLRAPRKQLAPPRTNDRMKPPAAGLSSGWTTTTQTGD